MVSYGTIHIVILEGDPDSSKKRTLRSKGGAGIVALANSAIRKQRVAHLLSKDEQEYINRIAG
jgi:hypothetical protein